MDELIGQWQARIRDAAAARTPIRLRGGGTKDFYGESLEGDVLDTRAYRGIVDYDPTELVMTARAGTPLAAIEAEMRNAGQMLAFEPPSFGGDATLGGCIAAGLSGPRRPFAGSVRDLVLGVRVLDGEGNDASFGGRVMKNVAGFDVARLMTGSLGTLGLLLEISLKCIPLPKHEATRVLECSADDAIRKTNEWGGKPLPISATCFHRGRLAVRLSGAAPAVEAAERKIGGSALADGDAFWRAVREQEHPYFAPSRSDGASLWRLSVRSTAPYTDLGGDQLVEWGSSLRWMLVPDGADASKLRTWAQSHGGHATLFRGRDKTAGVFHPLPSAMVALSRRLKSTFDPAGILNRRRLFSDF